MRPRCPRSLPRSSPRALIALIALIALAAALLAAAGCDSRTVPLADTAPQFDSGHRLDSAPARDGVAARDRAISDGPLTDGAPPPPDAFTGQCSPGKVYLLSDCLPTDEIDTCGPPPGPACDPNAPSCPVPGSYCDPWAATAHPVSSATMPLCIPPKMKPLGGPLRISPTSGVAGQPVALTIKGSHFYIGALYYVVRIAGTDYMDSGGSTCRLQVNPFTPSKPGIYVVEVSQYGGGPPHVLAGFFTASGGVPPPSDPQPGYHCQPGQTCAQATPYSCACLGGRCACK